MATNYVQDGRVVTLTMAADVRAGDPVRVGQLFGVALNHAGNGESTPVQLEGVFSLPKAGTDTFEVGARAYFKASDGTITSTKGSHLAAGVVVAAAAAADARVTLRLTP